MAKQYANPLFLDVNSSVFPRHRHYNGDSREIAPIAMQPSPISRRKVRPYKALSCKNIVTKGDCTARRRAYCRNQRSFVVFRHLAGVCRDDVLHRLIILVVRHCLPRRCGTSSLQAGSYICPNDVCNHSHREAGGVRDIVCVKQARRPAAPTIAQKQPLKRD